MIEFFRLNINFLPDSLHANLHVESETLNLIHNHRKLLNIKNCKIIIKKIVLIWRIFFVTHDKEVIYDVTFLIKFYLIREKNGNKNFY